MVFVKAKKIPKEPVKCSRNDAGLLKLCSLLADESLSSEQTFVRSIRSTQRRHIGSFIRTARIFELKVALVHWCSVSLAM